MHVNVHQSDVARGRRRAHGDDHVYYSVNPHDFSNYANLNGKSDIERERERQDSRDEEEKDLRKTRCVHNIRIFFNESFMRLRDMARRVVCKTINCTVYYVDSCVLIVRTFSKSDRCCETGDERRPSLLSRVPGIHQWETCSLKSKPLSEDRDDRVYET